MNCSEYLVDFLIKKGITDVFGYAGGYIVPFMDALYKRRDEITTHVCYNEQGCALSADGYARSTGKVGVVFATSGPGATNLTTGVATAYMDSSPVVFISCKQRKSLIFYGIILFFIKAVPFIDIFFTYKVLKLLNNRYIYSFLRFQTFTTHFEFH